MQKSVSIRQIATTNSSIRDNIARIETLFYTYFPYLRTRIIINPSSSKNLDMSFIDFFHDAPVLATIATLAYAVIVGVFVYILIRMYKK